ncbi:MAG: cytochrome c [Parvularculaceae bacterium]
MRSLLLSALIAISSSAAFADDAGVADGAKVYQRCAACHLPNGAGVPGAFPQLAGRVSTIASTDAGRDYLVMAITAGLIGELDVEGVKYRGIMPAQAGLSDADVASALNYVVSLKPAIAKADDAGAAKPQSFTTEEVAAIRARFPGANPQLAHGLREGAFKQPGKQPGAEEK